jgi:hypothetical protein
MRLIISLTAALVVCAGAAQVQAKVKPAAKPASFQLNQTSWTFVDNGTKIRESIDADGNYIQNAASGKHLDHGTAVMKGNKACFTSAMTKEGEVCWTTSPVRIGQSMHSVSDKGKKLTIKRVSYAKLSMPK